MGRTALVVVSMQIKVFRCRSFLRVRKRPDRNRVIPMEMIMLDSLEAWFAQNGQFMADQGLSVELGRSSSSQSSNRSVRVDIDSEDRVGQIILWETGEIEITLGSVGSDDMILDVGEIRSLDELWGWLRKLLTWNGVDRLWPA